MTDTALAALIGFGTVVANQFFTAWRSEQVIKERALELRKETQHAADKVAQATKDAAIDLAAKQMAAEIKASLERQTLRTELRENTTLTKIGNGIKSDILNNRRDINELKAANSAAADAQLNRIEQHGLDRTIQMNRMENTETDTNEKVNDLHGELK